MKYDKLIFGKSDIEHIVGIEANGDKAYLFIERPDGSKETKIVQNRYWILAPFNIGSSFSKLAGNLYYKWGRQFTDWDDFVEHRQKYKKLCSEQE